MAPSALTTAAAPGGRSVLEQAQLRVAVGVDRAVVVEVVAAEIGEARGREAHAVEPALLDAVRGRLHGEMGDAVAGEPVEGLVQRDRIGRRQRAVGRRPPR